MTFGVGTMPRVYFYCSVCDRMMHSTHDECSRKAARSHYRSEHPLEASKFHIIFTLDCRDMDTDEDLRNSCTCGGSRYCRCAPLPSCPSDHYYDDTHAHILATQIYFNGYELRILAPRGNDQNDYVELISSDDQSSTLSIDFIAAEKMYRLYYVLHDNGLIDDISIGELVFPGHIDEEAAVPSYSVDLGIVVETRYLGEPWQRYYGTNGCWKREVLPVTG